MAPLLPASVIGRTKAPYPVTHDPACHRAITGQARDLLERPGTDHATRSGIDFALNLDLWLRTAEPQSGSSVD